MELFFTDDNNFDVDFDPTDLSVFSDDPDRPLFSEDDDDGDLYMAPFAPLPEEKSPQTEWQKFLTGPGLCGLNYQECDALVTSSTMFASTSWPRLRSKYTCVPNGAYVDDAYTNQVDFHAWRSANNVCAFDPIDSRCKERTGLFHEYVRAVAQCGNRRPYKERTRGVNADHHMIPLVCCDRARRSMMWLPLDANVRVSRTHTWPSRGQPMFIDFPTHPDLQNSGIFSGHPFIMYQEFLHGYHHEEVRPKLKGYYPLRQDMANASPLSKQRMWAARESLTMTDAFCILKKLATVDADSWATVMKFLPFNEKCGWAQYLSTTTASSLYGVAYPVGRARLGVPTMTRYIFTNNVMRSLRRMDGIPSIALQSASRAAHQANIVTSHTFNAWLRRANTPYDGTLSDEKIRWTQTQIQWANERYKDAFLVGMKAKTDKLTKPFFCLWHMKTVYDLSNFCNRHAVRSAALGSIQYNIQHYVVPAIRVYTHRMSDIAATKVVLDGNYDQTVLQARHLVEHGRYMQAWRDMADLTALGMCTDEPDQAEYAKAFRDWNTHAQYCRKYAHEPRYDHPSLQTQWSIRRLYTLEKILYRYMGKKFNSLLSFLSDQDCALRHVLALEASFGRVTVLNLLSYQISCVISIDFKLLYGDCVYYNYQQMACPALEGISACDAHKCGNPRKCTGCDCPASIKYETAAKVRRMFEDLTNYQHRLDVCYDDDEGTQGMIITHKKQRVDHLSRMRVHSAMAPTGAPDYLKPDTCYGQIVRGLNALVSGESTAHEAPPIQHNTLRYGMHIYA